MASSAQAAQVLLDVVDVEKSYGATKVLRGVGFQVRAGEIHALLGGNGAGKSTLIRIATGATRLDAGRVTLASARPGRSEPVVAVVHQELALLPDLSVSENIGLVHTRRGAGLIDRTAMRAIAHAALAIIDPRLAAEALDRPARELTLHEGQIVEIARALSTGAEILLLDEPTANLTGGEAATLFALLRRLAIEEGMGIVFVSHRMKEIRQLCDRCTIIRDGITAVNGAAMASITDAEIVQHMGQPANKVAQIARERRSATSAAVELHGPHDTVVAVPAGSILGLAGSPSGPAALIAALVGTATRATWSIRGVGLPEHFSSPAHAVRSGVGFVSGDRAAKGILSELPIIDNVMAARRVRNGQHLVSRAEQEACAGLVGALKLRAGSLWDLPRTLSGGNQQKLLLARWLRLPLKLIVFEEPTRGVDIGTKHAIYGIIRTLAEDGAIVVWYSTENVELLELCDAIFAFDTDGRPAGLLPDTSFNEDGLSALTGMAA